MDGSGEPPYEDGRLGRARPTRMDGSGEPVLRGWTARESRPTRMDGSGEPVLRGWTARESRATGVDGSGEPPYECGRLGRAVLREWTARESRPTSVDGSGEPCYEGGRLGRAALRGWTARESRPTGDGRTRFSKPARESDNDHILDRRSAGLSDCRGRDARVEPGSMGHAGFSGFRSLVFQHADRGLYRLLGDGSNRADAPGAFVAAGDRHHDLPAVEQRNRSPGRTQATGRGPRASSAGGRSRSCWGSHFSRELHTNGTA